MRLHTNVITADHVNDALKTEQAAGRIDQSVSFKQLATHNSRSHHWAIEVQLSASQPGRGRRAGNAGSYNVGGAYAATYDEWGWLIAALYRIDPDAIWGSVQHPQYAGADHFHDLTGLTYNPTALLDALETGTHGFTAAEGQRDLIWDPFPYVTGRNTIGRRGAMRRSADDVPSYAIGTWAKLQPRTAEWVRAFAAGKAF